MSETLFDKSSGDLDGTEETITEVTSSTLEGEKTLFHYYNALNENVDVVVTGSRAGDDDFSEGVQLNSETVSSGGNAGFYVVSDPWEQIEVSLTPAANPSSGSLSVYKSVDN